MTTDSRPLAMLVDGDNAQAALLEHVLAEAGKYGTVTTRRIYGDWTTKEMGSWKDSLHSLAIQPVQQFRYTKRKNSTDSALIIDAMDLLHSGTVGGFCIVSSDSDYTRLATRVREQGLFVMGVGRGDTPEAFVKACQVFVYTENLSPPEGSSARSPEASSEWVALTRRAIEMTIRDDGWAFLASVGHALRQLDPAFDVRTYGHQRLWPLVESRPDLFEVREEKTQEGPSQVFVRLKN
ncbi:MAG: NYN domain-containing protein [Chloroflexi bacterium]|nr:NYN domain-containing protein [Chloroflexota bacterium]